MNRKQRDRTFPWGAGASTYGIANDSRLREAKKVNLDMYDGIEINYLRPWRLDYSAELEFECHRRRAL